MSYIQFICIRHTINPTNFIFSKNLSKNNAKSLASLRQKLKKYVKDFEEEMSKFRENPDLPDEDEEKGIFINYYQLDEKKARII